MEKETRVTDWCKTKEEIEFAVKQIEKYGNEAEIKERVTEDVISYAVFRR